MLVDLPYSMLALPKPPSRVCIGPVESDEVYWATDGNQAMLTRYENKSRLTHTERSIVDLADQGLSVPEIARRLGTTKGRIRWIKGKAERKRKDASDGRNH